MDQIESNVIAWLLSTLLGSGVVLGIAWYALRGRLEEVFQTRRDADARRQAHDRDIGELRHHVDAEFLKIDRTMEGLDGRVKENAQRSSRTEAKVDVLTERVAGQGDKLGGVQESLARVDEKIDRLAAGQAATAEALKGVTQSLDQLRHEVRGRGS